VVAARLTKPVAMAWAKNVPAPTSAMPTRTTTRLGARTSGNPSAATSVAGQNVRRVPKRSAARPASGVVTIDGRNTR